MSQVVLIEHMDGSVSIEVPGDFSLQHILDHLVPSDAKSAVISDRNLIPLDRTFRNAWSKLGFGVVVDMPKAREIWRQRMREARAPLLASLDQDYMRADEADDKNLKKLVADKKKLLRDVTADPAIEAAKSPEDLKAAWPEPILGPKR